MKERQIDGAWRNTLSAMKAGETDFYLKRENKTMNVHDYERKYRGLSLMLQGSNLMKRFVSL
ncbi:hypothetical protein KSF_064450 [Reticulibacter mediterranei]|uniref:Uncharacterized protein n=1 Tax=Reticulibacter mediterranei TaxID=2778369 RepID=A0A8J3N2W8_9CHLR|nr:hypothetical protein KSF_064450 [Reticulibacter mediterranei]